MAHLRTQQQISLTVRFEKELKHRVSLRKQSNISDETVLLRTFKYYDLDNSGQVTKDQFYKVIEKLGFTIYNKQDIFSLFEMYANGNRLNYRQFVQSLLQGPIQTDRGLSPLRNNFANNNPEERLQRLQKKIREDGPGAFLKFCESLTAIGPAITLEEFQKIVEKYLPKQEDARILHAYLDVHKSGSINTRSLMNSLRGPIGYIIQDKVNGIFKTLSNNQKFLEAPVVVECFSESVRRFDPSQHFKQLEQFLERLKIYMYITNSKERRFDSETFTEFNFMVWYDISDEISFIKLMEEIYINAQNPLSSANINQSQVQAASYQKSRQTSAYRPDSAFRPDLTQTTPVKRLDFRDDASQPEENVPDAEDILQKVRQMLVRRGTKSFISLHRQLRIKDEDSDGKITLPELKRAFGDYHIELSEAEFKAFFQSQESKGRITIDNFMSTLVGPLSPFKLELINQVFSMLDRDWDDLILLNELKNTYTARYHPDVRKGRKSESEVLAEFLDSFEAHHVLYSNIRDPKVSRREFRTYYQVVGAINDDDQTFDEIIKGTFKSLFDAAPIQGNLQQSKNFVAQNAPYGTTDLPTDYGRPSSSAVERGNSSSKGKAAGVPSWPGYVLQFQEPQTNEFRESVQLVQTKVKQRGLRGILQVLKALLKQLSSNACIYESSGRQLSRSQIGLAFQEVRIQVDNRAIFELMGKLEQISLRQLCQILFGPLSDYRKTQIQQVFGRLQFKPLSLEQLKSNFSPRNHPDVIRGAKTDEEVLVQFLDTFETHYQLFNGNSDRLVSLEQFEHYYWMLSALSVDDRYFSQMLNSGWSR